MNGIFINYRAFRLKEFQLTPPLTPVALVKFRKRFNKDRMAQINEYIVLAEQAAKNSKEEVEREEDNHHNDDHGLQDAEKKENKTTTDPDLEESRPNQGTLILDATCTPADIKYPTDLGLLNESREKLEEIIDTLHEANGRATKRPRTYREKARKVYLSMSKQRNPRKKQLRKEDTGDVSFVFRRRQTKRPQCLLRCLFLGARVDKSGWQSVE